MLSTNQTTCIVMGHVKCVTIEPQPHLLYHKDLSQKFEKVTFSIESKGSNINNDKVLEVGETSSQRYCRLATGTGKRDPLHLPINLDPMTTDASASSNLLCASFR